MVAGTGSAVVAATATAAAATTTTTTTAAAATAARMSLAQGGDRGDAVGRNRECADAQKGAAARKACVCSVVHHVLSFRLAPPGIGASGSYGVRV